MVRSELSTTAAKRHRTNDANEMGFSNGRNLEHLAATAPRKRKRAFYRDAPCGRRTDERREGSTQEGRKKEERRDGRNESRLKKAKD